MSWRKTISEAPAKSWRDTVTSEKEEPGIIPTAVVKSAAGVSLGLDDELAGALSTAGRVVGIEGLGGQFKDMSFADGPTLDADKLSDAYTSTRDSVRKLKGEMDQAHPELSTAAEVVGSLALPGATAKTAGGRLLTSAAAGGVSGFGNSTETDATGLAKDTASGAGLGAGFQALGDKVIAPAMKSAGSFTDKIMQAAAQKSPTANRLMSKVAQFTSGVDEDAALRQIERPMQTAAAESDDFAFKIGKNAVHDTEALGTQLGTSVASAKQKFLQNSGEKIHDVGVLSQRVGEFLEANKPSARGFSGLSSSQRSDLIELQKMLDGPINGEDLVKIRDHLDHVERLAGKYDQDGTGPFIGFLKHLRGTADGILDKADPGIDAANTAFSQYKADTGLLRGATNDGQAESMINNLYGANKNMQREAAGRLFMPDTLEAAEDIASNKAFNTATRPGGDNYFRRGALAAITMGTSEVVTNPQVWQKGLRGMGRLEQTIKSNPQMFGKYSTVLADAVSRGPKALAATHFILSQKDGQYRELTKELDKDDAK